MSTDQDWDEFIDSSDLESESSQQQSEGRNPLRDVVRGLEKELKQVRTDLASERASKREQLIEQVLTNKGVNPKVAKLVPEESAKSRESIEQWLSEYNDLFSGQSQEQTGNETPEGMTAEDTQALKDMASTSQSATPPGLQHEEQTRKLRDPNLSPQQLLDMIYNAQSGR